MTPKPKAGIPDQPDRCPILLDCDNGFHVDNDGCPDVALRVDGRTGRLVAPGPRLLRELAQEIRRLGIRLKRLVIVGQVPTALGIAAGLKAAEQVRKLLLHLGISGATLQTKGRTHQGATETTVTFEPTC